MLWQENGGGGGGGKQPRYAQGSSSGMPKPGTCQLIRRTDTSGGSTYVGWDPTEVKKAHLVRTE